MRSFSVIHPCDPIYKREARIRCGVLCLENGAFDALFVNVAGEGKKEGKQLSGRIYERRG